jgi:hypothetical protein
VHAPPRRSNGWWISPVIPVTANCALAALWAFSGFGGWATAAFCGDQWTPDPRCAAGVEHAMVASSVPAALAVVTALAAWALPRVRRDDARLDRMLTLAAFIWVAAEAVLFVGGVLARLR